jgi:hypothetical protein
MQTNLPHILTSRDLDQIHNHAELMRLLADIDEPLRRMDDNLKDVQDNLQGQWSIKGNESLAHSPQHPSAQRYYCGCRANHTFNIMSRRSRTCFQEPGNGFSLNLCLKSGRMKVRPPSYGFTEFLGRAKASWCKLFVYQLKAITMNINTF